MTAIFSMPSMKVSHEIADDLLHRLGPSFGAGKQAAKLRVECALDRLQRALPGLRILKQSLVDDLLAVLGVPLIDFQFFVGDLLLLCDR